MSTSLNRTGRVQPPETTELTTTNPTTVFSSSTKQIDMIEAIVLTNVDNSNACIVKLEWADSTPTWKAFYNKNVAAADTVVIENIPLLLDGNGKVRTIRATAAAANDIFVTVIASAQTKQAPA